LREFFENGKIMKGPIKVSKKSCEDFQRLKLAYLDLASHDGILYVAIGSAIDILVHIMQLFIDHNVGEIEDLGESLEINNNRVHKKRSFKIMRHSDPRFYY
jgi:hypothetical protein